MFGFLYCVMVNSMTYPLAILLMLALAGCGEEEPRHAETVLLPAMNGHVLVGVKYADGTYKCPASPALANIYTNIEQEKWRPK